ncbi:glutaminyl-peptide cyclotransferase [Flavobacterium sp.]|uniref:glutaminyl-peptide cyclotransferase n=1 Tax=Flavobacterium sp. TaxID=239 RepID=UPI0026147D94|nr:glutaminyl-peptide cyclotransferase [Flavobacterium sp.]
MKNYKSLAVILLAVLSFSCNKTEEDNFSINEEKLKAQYTTNDAISLQISNLKDQKIDSVVFNINDKRVGSSNGTSAFTFPLKNQKLGYQNIKATTYFDGTTELDSTRIEIVSDIEPKLLTYTIVNTYPHDIKAYTQGLEFYRDTLYEGTGNGAGNGTGIRGISSLRKTNYKTGEVYKKIELPDNVFGEGITVLNNKVYYLTYKNQEAYVFNADTFKKEKTFPYFKNMEGWGLTTDGKNLYMNDGSEKIHIIDPNTFKQIDYLNVYSGANKIPNINEMEWIDGKIYSNIYQKQAVIIIDPKTGKVEGILDFTKLLKLRTELPDTDEFNGIAYNPKTKTLFVTGKNWDKMFEIKINQ